MRGAFIKTLVELAERDPRILLLTGDLGYMALEPFSEKFPDRFFNVGVAEQNMVGLAADWRKQDFSPSFIQLQRLCRCGRTNSFAMVPFSTTCPFELLESVGDLNTRMLGQATSVWKTRA